MKDDSLIKVKKQMKITMAEDQYLSIATNLNPLYFSLVTPFRDNQIATVWYIISQLHVKRTLSTNMPKAVQQNCSRKYKQT